VNAGTKENGIFNIYKNFVNLFLTYIVTRVTVKAKKFEQDI